MVLLKRTYEEHYFLDRHPGFGPGERREALNLEKRDDFLESLNNR
jgi:hypothetical protein